MPADGQPPSAAPATALTVPVGSLVPEQEPSAAITFRMGEYEIGDGYCPLLWGQPGTRY